MFSGSGIGDIVVLKLDLINILTINEAGHEAVYEKAIAAYRVKAIDALDQMLEQVRSGHLFARQDVPPVLARQVKARIPPLAGGVVALAMYHLPTPENHVADYQRAIDMLNLHQGDTVTLSEDAYRKLVDDEWEWSALWTHNTLAYTNGGIR